MNILISSAGRRVVLLKSFRNALREFGTKGKVYAVDMSFLSSAFHEADNAWIVPECKSPLFISEVLNICKREQIELIVPTIDTELMIYSQNREKFKEAGTMVAVSSPETIRITQDKVNTNQWLTKKGFPTVKQYKPEHLDDIIQELEFPVIIKPRFGSAAIGVHEVSDAELLRYLWKSIDEPIIQEKAKGEEHTINVFVNSNGSCICQVPYKRIEIRSGEVSKGITVKSNELMNITKNIAESLPGAFGAMCMQCFWDKENNIIKVIEINARFGGGYPLPLQAGANFSLWLLQEISGVKVSQPYNQWEDDLAILRYDDAIFVNNFSNYESKQKIEKSEN